MSHQISLPADIGYVALFLLMLCVLIGSLLFAVRVKEFSRGKEHISADAKITGAPAEVSAETINEAA